MINLKLLTPKQCEFIAKLIEPNESWHFVPQEIMEKYLVGNAYQIYSENMIFSVKIPFEVKKVSEIEYCQRGFKYFLKQGDIEMITLYLESIGIL